MTQFSTPTGPPDPDHDETELAALVGSRICHDLISPLGAVSNGLELLAMAGGGAAGPEAALIEESVANATARIRFFRIAFGHAAEGGRMGRPEIQGVLDDLTRGGRISVDWQAEGDVPRREVKLAFLILLCFETVLAFGGDVEFSREGGNWRASAWHERLRAEPALWSRLDSAKAAPAGKVSAGEAQFALAPAEAAQQGRSLTVDLTEQAVTVAW